MNINRDYLIINDVKKSNIKLDNGSIFFYITDKNTQNIFVNLVINVSNNDLIQKFANIENAEDYTLTMNIVKPDNTYKIIEGKLHDKEKAIFEFNLNEDCCDEIGTYRCELLTKCNINNHEEITTSNKLTYKVKSSVLNDLDDIVEAPEYPLVIQLFDKLSDIEQYEEDRRANEVARQLAEEQRQTRFNALDADMVDRVNAMDNKMADVENRIVEKEEAVDTLISDTKADIDEYKVAKDTEINAAITAQDNKIERGITGVNSQIKNIVSKFTTEQTDNLYKIKYDGIIIAEIPIGNTAPTLETFGNLLSTISTWNAMGDSITDETIEPKTKYPTILKNKYTNMTTVNNYGHSGWSIAIPSNSSFGSFLTLIDSMSSSCDLITIAGGVNDFLHSVPIGERSSTLDTEFYGAVNNLITRLRAKYPNTPIIWIIPLPVTDGVYESNDDGTNPIGNTLDDYRKALRNKLHDLQVPAIDLSTDPDMDPSKISTDGLHPTAAGQEIFANKLDNSIPSIPLEEQSINCTNIALNPSTLTFTDTNSQTLVATVTPSNTTDTIIWQSSNTNVATVENGVVVPIAVGECTITATCGDYSATCAVTVSGISESGGDTSDYTDISYIESTGTQYINTRIVPTASTKIELVAEMSASKQYDHIFGSDNFMKVQWDDDTGTAIDVVKKNAQSQVFTLTLGKHTYVMDMTDTTNSITIDGTNYGNTIGHVESTTCPLLLLSGYKGDGTIETGFCGIGKIYSCKIYYEDTLVANMKPILTNSGTYGLLDTVNNTFYASEVGNFTGPVPPSGGGTEPINANLVFQVDSTSMNTADNTLTDNIAGISATLTGNPQVKDNQIAFTANDGFTFNLNPLSLTTKNRTVRVKFTLANSSADLQNVMTFGESATTWERMTSCYVGSQKLVVAHGHINFSDNTVGSTQGGHGNNRLLTAPVAGQEYELVISENIDGNVRWFVDGTLVQDGTTRLFNPSYLGNMEGINRFIGSYSLIEIYNEYCNDYTEFTNMVNN